jgi:hypothetical protein
VGFWLILALGITASAHLQRRRRAFASG